MTLGDILTIFRPGILADEPSSYNGRVLVKKGLGQKYITTSDHSVTQSGEIVGEVWRPVIKKIGQEGKSWLILGLAGATVPQMISAKLKPSRMLGVEIDPVMIKLAQKFFFVDKIPELKIVNADAKDFMSKLKDRFDYCLVDMYVGANPPDFIYRRAFIKDAKRCASVVVFNHLFHTDENREKAKSLSKTLESYFSQVTLTRSHANLLLTCS